MRKRMENFYILILVMHHEDNKYVWLQKRAVPFKLESVTMLVMNIPEVSLFIL